MLTKKFYNVSDMFYCFKLKLKVKRSKKSFLGLRQAEPNVKWGVDKL